MGAFRRAEGVAIGLMATALILLSLPEDRQLSLARRTNHIVLFPMATIQQAMSGHMRLREENARLREQLQRSRLELSATDAIRIRNRELERLLGFEEGQPVAFIPARVIDRNFATLPTTFMIDAGVEDGVSENLPVVTDLGLVGKTVATGARTSEVLLYTHPQFSASALLVGGDHLEYGIVRPAPNGAVRFFLPLRSRSNRGDKIVTSGYGGTFPRGIPVGTVNRTEQDERLGLQKIDLVEPVVDLNVVTTVFVMARSNSPGRSAGGVTRLFWPGFAYPPMVGEGRGDTGAGTKADSTEGSVSDVRDPS